jgi:hypothetical protein
VQGVVHSGVSSTIGMYAGFDPLWSLTYHSHLFFPSSPCGVHRCASLCAAEWVTKTHFISRDLDSIGGNCAGWLSLWCMVNNRSVCQIRCTH